MPSWKQVVLLSNFTGLLKKSVYNTIRYQSNARIGSTTNYYFPDGDNLRDHNAKWVELDSDMTTIDSTEIWGGFLCPYNGKVKKIICQYYQNSWSSFLNIPILLPNLWRYDGSDWTDGNKIWEGSATSMNYNQIKVWEDEDFTIPSSVNSPSFEAGDILMPSIKQTAGQTGKTFHGTWTIVLKYETVA